LTVNQYWRDAGPSKLYITSGTSDAPSPSTALEVEMHEAFRNGPLRLPGQPGRRGEPLVSPGRVDGADRPLAPRQAIIQWLEDLSAQKSYVKQNPGVPLLRTERRRRPCSVSHNLRLHIRREMLSSTFQGLGIPADPRRTAQARPPGQRVHNPPGPQGAEDPARTATAHRHDRRVAPVHCCTGAPSGPRMPLITARSPSKPLGRFRSSAAARCFPPAGTDVSSGGRWRVRGVSGCRVRRWACRGGPGSPP
jgi:hypothetical protein